MISSARVTPASPIAPSPYRNGAADVGALGAERQRLEHVLAGADAAVHVHLDAVADRLDDRPAAREIDEGAPSSWRPPWLETISASAPVSAASRASSASRMPLRISLPPQRFLIHSTSSQDRRGSNCSAVHADSERHVAHALRRGRRCCRSCGASCPACPGTSAAWSPCSGCWRSVSLGGADRPFFRSLWRWPRICRSSVSTSAEQLAALARSIRRSMKSRSRIT